MVKKSYRVTVFEDLCKACGICIELCPTKVFVAQSDGKSKVENEERCTSCLMCEMHCPDFCVEVEEKAND